MNYIVKSFYTLSAAEKKEFYNFCKIQSTETTLPAAKNMWHDNWKDHNGTLPFLLENTDRFRSKGDFYILYEDEEIIACGGVYISDFSTSIAICGVRTWVSKNSRHKSILKDYLLPAHKKWCNLHAVKILALTFNDYNKNLIQVFKRKRLGETINRISSRAPHHLFYSGVNEVPFALSIQYTKQWAIYEKLSDWEFDWETIKWKND